jgi:hypothetical protein
MIIKCCDSVNMLGKKSSSILNKIYNVLHCYVRNLSNPNRIHSGQKDKEKEGYELLWAVICCKPPLSPSPTFPPPHIARLSHSLRPCYQD